MLNPSDNDRRRRIEVIQAMLEKIRDGVMIKLPDFDPAVSQPSEKALLSVSLIPNPYGGTVDQYRYQFEGEEDLLHLIITRIDEQPLTVEEAQQAAGFLLKGVSPALIWLKPGEYSQHFYFGHDDMAASIDLS